jgi:aminoglycoside phosphotransferase (APT) family kinase protein
MSQRVDDNWIAYFKKHGYSEASGIAAGMEGAVYSLVPEELVAKVWFTTQHESKLRRLQKFYKRLALSSNRIHTPEIIDLEIVGGTLISKERFLHGIPIQEHLSADTHQADEQAIDALIKILEFLRSVDLFEESRLLAVLDDDIPLWTNVKTWSESVQALISRRIKRFGAQLQRDIPDLEKVIGAIHLFLNSRDKARMGIIHGDLCAANIMVDKNLHPLSVFDFGFLSTAGDPAFDASIASAVFNMYGTHAQEIDRQVTEAFASSLGYEERVLLAYKAVYAIITSNAYAEDSSDGHYRWCVAILQRKDVRSSLGL